MRDNATLDARTRQMEELAREGRYPFGSYLPELARGFVAFERGAIQGAIAALAPLARQSERIGGSRAQHDLIEITLLRPTSTPTCSKRRVSYLLRAGPGPREFPSRALRR